MKTIISAKKMNIPKAFDEYAKQRIDSRLSKFFGDDADAKIVMSETKNQIVVELTVRYNNIISDLCHNFISVDDLLQINTNPFNN